MPTYQERIDLLIGAADNLNNDIYHIRMEMEKAMPSEPPGWYEDCINELQDAEGKAALAVGKLTEAWDEFKREGE